MPEQITEEEKNKEIENEIDEKKPTINKEKPKNHWKMAHFPV